MPDSQLALIVPTLKEVLEEVSARQTPGHPKRYRPLDATSAQMIREHFATQAQMLGFVLTGSPMPLYTPRGTLLARWYQRVVVGDYGAFVEIERAAIPPGTLKSRFAGEPTRPVKYLWLLPTDGSDIQIYDQRGTVDYADYKPGMLYVAPQDVRLDNKP